MAVPVLVLKSFAIQSGAAGGCAGGKTPRALGARRPREIADALEAEHRIEDVERHHHQVRMAVRSRRPDPGRERAPFVDALFENLSRLVFPVIHHLVAVDRLVLLSYRGGDRQLPERPSRPKGAGFAAAAVP